MTRILDQKLEDRETKRRLALVRALEFGIVGALGNQGFELRGFGIKYSEWDCLLTIRTERDGKGFVSHVASDTMINCFIKCEAQILGNSLRWNTDRYYKEET